MPSPKTTATARPDLGLSFMEMRADSLLTGFVGTRVFPIFDTPKQASSFKKVKIASLLESMDTSRAPGSSYNRSKWEFDDGKYACSEHGEEEPIDDRDAENYGDYFEIEMISTARARYAVMLGHEQRVRDAVRGATGTAAVAATWKNASSAKPLTDVETAIRALRGRGVIANQLVLSWEDYRNCRLTDQVADKIASMGAGSSIEPARITPQKLAEVFDIEEVVVAEGLTNTANVNQDVSISDIWTPGTITVHRAARSRDLSEPCSGRTFHWTGDGSQEEALVESYRQESVRSDIVRVRFESDETKLFDEAIQNITGAAA